MIIPSLNPQKWVSAIHFSVYGAGAPNIEALGNTGATQTYLGPQATTELQYTQRSEGKTTLKVTY